jgi:hypothetical protein
MFLHYYCVVFLYFSYLNDLFGIRNLQNICPLIACVRKYDSYIRVHVV